MSCYVQGLFYLTSKINSDIKSVHIPHFVRLVGRGKPIWGEGLLVDSRGAEGKIMC